MADVKPIATFTREHPKTGQKQERIAYSPSERVQLTADGWVEKPSSKSSTSSTSAGPAGGKPNNN